MTAVRRADGVHFSDLSRMALSPAHYRASVERSREARTVTRNMRIGTVAHRLILGKRPGHEIVMWDGQRRGKAWDAFEAAHEGQEIVTADECIEAQAIADSALANPVVRELLETPGLVTEAPLTWEDSGIVCSTSGVDMLAPGLIGDLKTARTTQPDRFSRQALQYGYHAQVCFYARGARAAGYEIGRLLVVGVEPLPPHAVTVLELTPKMVEAGERALTGWIEQLRACEDSDAWPAYGEAPVLWDPPPWLDVPGADDDDGGEATGEIFDALGSDLFEAAS